jgi:hypothetical protein
VSRRRQAHCRPGPDSTIIRAQCDLHYEHFDIALLTLNEPQVLKHRINSLDMHVHTNV